MGSLQVVVRTCEECGNTFEQQDGRRSAFTCSAECRAARARRRAREWFKANYVPSSRVSASPVCSVPGCGKPNSGKELCSMHRKRLKLHGTVDLPDILCSRCGKPTGRQGVGIGICSACRPEAHAEANSAWKKANPQRMRANRHRERLARYGLTADTFDALLLEQGGACAICRRPYDPTHTRGWHIDHDSAKSRSHVRGVLCRRCNQALGQFDHDPALLRSAADYLVRARLRQSTRKP